MSQPARVAILGGGYAGMAAAVALAARGVPLTVFEAAGNLGGRARRVEYRGPALDNGLHILIGAYRDTLALIGRVHPNVDRVLLRRPLEWRIGERFCLRALPLPPPLDLAGGLLTARGASFAERLSALRFMRKLVSARCDVPRDITVARLLEVHRQDGAMARFVWRPLCIAALNTPPEEASAQVFANVLRESFGGARGSTDVLLARCDLSELFPAPAAGYVRARGGEVLLGHTVTAVAATDRGYRVEARGESRTFDHVICALPPHRLAAAIDGLPQLESTARMVANFAYQPIYTVYLQYGQRLPLAAPMVGLTGGLGHWVFDREAICGEAGRVAVVISARGAHQQLDHDALARSCHEELAATWGPLPAPLWSRVIAEKRATFACTPALERPQMRTALPGFWLAGDYVASPHPATIEAAVRSGLACAREVIAEWHSGG